MSLLKHCADGNLTEIQTLLSRTKGRRNKVQARDNHNWTCLHHAVRSQSVECIKYLLTIDELDTTAETFEGETALHIACDIPNISLEIVSVLVEANPDLVNYVNNEEVDLLNCAVMRKRLDIVQLLIANGAPQNKQDLDGDTALHIAAIEVQLDVIRYLVYDAHCDPTICNEKEKTACFLLFAKLLQKVLLDSSLSSEEIDCFDELAQFTYTLHDVNNPNENELELNQMINLGYHYDQPRSCLYARIVKLFYVPPSKQYFFEKILLSNVPSCHCLIIALLSTYQQFNTDSGQTFEMWSKFLLELFTLFLSDESFFNEYISEIMSSGWRYSERSQAVHFCTFITLSKDSLEPQKLFTFLKALILYEIDFDALIRNCEILLMPTLMLTVFAPLAKFVIPSYPLGCNFLNCNYNLNESDDILLVNRNRSKDLKSVHEVVSLKNMCRMSIRRHSFETYSHYTAIKALHSFKLPIPVRNFLCYNFCNFKF